MASSRAPSPARRPKVGVVMVVSDVDPYDGSFPFASEPCGFVFIFGLPLFILCALLWTPFGSGPHGALWAVCAIVVWFSGAFMRGSRMIRGGGVFWGATTGVGVLYIAFLCAALTQPLSSLQTVAAWLDPINATGPAGTSLPEQSYGAACALTWDNVRHHCDIFVAAHVLGWVGKALMFRDAAISVALSLLFELMEYTFAYLLPNFHECWWDHWLLDFLLCNGLGILLGHALMRATSMREYNWLGLRVVDRKQGLKGALTCFMSTSTSTLARDPRRAAGLVFLGLWIMAIDLNAFFLKYMLRVLPASPLNALRLALMALLGGAAMREYYAFLTLGTPFGPIGTVSLIGTFLETAVVFKFAKDVPEWQGLYAPAHYVNMWCAAVVCAFVAGVIVYWPLLGSGGGGLVSRRAKAKAT